MIHGHNVPPNQPFVEDYLAGYPHEGIRIQRLLDSIGAGSNLTTRTNFEGHVTCGAVLLDTTGRVIHIHHNALDRWLLPGGHLEEGDLTLQSAELRELNEETGISVSAVATVERFGARPIDSTSIAYQLMKPSASLRTGTSIFDTSFKLIRALSSYRLARSSPTDGCH